MSATDKNVTAKNTASGDIIIRIPGAYLRHHVRASEDFEEGSRVTNTKVFSDEILRALNDEQEDGTTPVHQMLDAVVLEAIENGAEGIKLAGEDE